MTVAIGGAGGIVILNETAAEHLQLIPGNRDLLKYAARNGEKVHLQVELQQQTLIAEHNVSVTLDCASLLEGSKSGLTVSWSALFDGDKGTCIVTE